ncbi:hypothetical protein FHS91_000636 [Sphingobium xanthum]|jgi:hypothetical protein|uniref:hypothetical protein n=1 Tax=Sphingobium xanthum TaxID=1387165 RepID=UPI001C8BC5EE|nr:hypothetical protein [Sphingobium xanthum]
MGLTSASDWIAWAGIVIPLAALAWSAVFYTLARRREVSHQEYQRLSEVMRNLGDHQASVTQKMAAAFELRKYPEYAPVIITVCENTKLTGDRDYVDMFRAELDKTADYLRAKL